MYNPKFCEDDQDFRSVIVETKQLFPEIDGDSGLKQHQGLDVRGDSAVDKREFMLRQQQYQQHKQQVRKSKPRPRSSQYRGVTFYRRTGRWESHIWFDYFFPVGLWEARVSGLNTLHLSHWELNASCPPSLLEWCCDFQFFLVYQKFMAEDAIFCGIFDGHGPHGHLVVKVFDALPLNLNSSLDGADCEVETRDKAASLWRDAFLKSYKLLDKELRSHPSLDCFCNGSTVVTIVKQEIHGPSWRFTCSNSVDS